MSNSIFRQFDKDYLKQRNYFRIAAVFVLTLGAFVFPCLSLAQDEQSEDTPTVYYLINDQSPLYYPYDWTTAEEWSGDVAPGSTNGAIFAVGSGYWLRVPFVYHSETKTYDPQTFPSLDGGAINSLYLGYSLQNGELVPDSGFLNVKIPSTTIDNLVIGNGTVYQGNALFENGKVLPQVLYGNITVNGNASFTVNNEAETDKRSMTIESLISGAGTLNFTTNVATTNPPATGFTIAHDSNPFTGPVTIDGNTRMAFSGENCLASASSITSAGDLILYANQTFKDFSGSGSLAIVNSDILTLNTTTDLTYAGLISGAGSLVKNGSGTFTLDGEYTYEGNTTVNDGSLVLTKKGDVRNLTGSGNLVNNSTYTITLQYDNDATFGGLSGNGSFTKAGPGDLTLTKAPDYQGKTTIMQGNLNLLAGGTLNNLTYNVTKNDIPAGDDLTTYIENNGNITIADNQTLTVNVTSDCNYLGVINPDLENSTAKLVKNGSGKWTLKSTLNKSVNCAIEINDGTVRLNNPLTTGYDRFGGDVTINKNGTLECLNKDSFGTGSTPLKIIINGGKLKLDSNNQTFTEKEFIFTGGSIIGESYEGIHLKAGTSITANAAEGATAEKPTVATITVPIKVRNIEGNDNPPKLNITVNKNAQLIFKNIVYNDNGKAREIDKIGSGVLTFDYVLGENENRKYSRPITVSEGVLQLKKDAVITKGKITVVTGAALELDVAKNDIKNLTVTSTNKIFSTGKVIKTGNGALKILAESKGLVSAESMVISSGRMDMKGYFRGQLYVDKNTVFSPGNSVGELTISSFTSDGVKYNPEFILKNETSKLLMEIGGTSISMNDSLIVEGPLTLNNGIIYLVLADENTLQEGDIFTAVLSGKNSKDIQSDFISKHVRADHFTDLQYIKLEGDQYGTYSGKYAITGRYRFNHNVVPEPSTWALMILGVAGLICLKKTRKK